MKFQIIVAALLVATASIAAATDFDSGLAAFDRGDYAAALQEFRPLAKGGHAGAQNYVGRMYNEGLGLAADSREAAKWYRRSAEQGLVRAQVELGSMSEHGRGVVRDHTSAAAWFRREAEQGDAEAQVKLAHMYAEGEGVPRDAVQALAWIVPVVLRDDFGAKEMLEDIRMFLTEDQMAEARERSSQLVDRLGHRGMDTPKRRG